MIEMFVTCLFALTATASLAVIIGSLIEARHAWRQTRAALSGDAAQIVTGRVTITELKVYQAMTTARPRMAHRIEPVEKLAIRPRMLRPLPLPAAA